MKNQGQNPEKFPPPSESVVARKKEKTTDGSKASGPKKKITRRFGAGNNLVDSFSLPRSAAGTKKKKIAVAGFCLGFPVFFVPVPSRRDFRSLTASPAGRSYPLYYSFMNKLGHAQGLPETKYVSPSPVGRLPIG